MSTVLIRDSSVHLGEMIEELGWAQAFKRGSTVFLKPNLTYPRHKPGVTTSPLFIEKVLSALADYGVRVIVGEGDGGYGSYSANLAFEGHGLHQICERFGADLINLSEAPGVKLALQASSGVVEFELPRLLLEGVDTFITLPVPKVHAMVDYSGAVKNQWGCLVDPMRLKLHPHFDSLIWEINRLLGVKYVLADAAYSLDKSGPMWGEAIYLGRVVAADDILACDVIMAKELLKLNPGKMAYLTQGRRLGLGWEPSAVRDSSTSPVHEFRLEKTLRSRITRYAFTREWAVKLLWFSSVGNVLHRIFYFVMGSPIKNDIEAVSGGDSEKKKERH